MAVRRGNVIRKSNNVDFLNQITTNTTINITNTIIIIIIIIIIYYYDYGY